MVATKIQEHCEIQLESIFLQFGDYSFHHAGVTCHDVPRMSDDILRTYGISDDTILGTVVYHFLNPNNHHCFSHHVLEDRRKYHQNGQEQYLLASLRKYLAQKVDLETVL